ncbi:MAG: erythromycin biosynthesis sensory transduction protein eryC1, partial [Candidatus Latescibacteria bacterium]|nr:erythromycin biosynthesis sensory transduction protein eryC1 [Candidatus Latescibacterota bacterium]
DRIISSIPGMNTRLDELQAAILRVKLRYLDKDNTRRKEIARMYGSLLSDSSLKLPQVKPDMQHVYHQYVVRSSQRDELRTFLNTHSIGTAIHYPVPVHLQPAYNERLNVMGGDIHNTVAVCSEILSLPIYPQLTDEQVKHVCGIINQFDKTF